MWADGDRIYNCSKFRSAYGDTFHITVDREEGFISVQKNNEEDNIEIFHHKVFTEEGELRPIMSFYNYGDTLEIINA